MNRIESPGRNGQHDEARLGEDDRRTASRRATGRTARRAATRLVEREQRVEQRRQHRDQRPLRSAHERAACWRTTSGSVPASAKRARSHAASLPSPAASRTARRAHPSLPSVCACGASAPQRRAQVVGERPRRAGARRRPARRRGRDGTPGSGCSCARGRASGVTPAARSPTASAPAPARTRRSARRGRPSAACRTTRISTVPYSGFGRTSQ